MARRRKRLDPQAQRVLGFLGVVLLLLTLIWSGSRSEAAVQPALPASKAACCSALASL